MTESKLTDHNGFEKKGRAIFLNEFIESWSEIYTDIPDSRRVKRHWIKEGFDNQISFYGVLTSRGTGESEFMRAEVLANDNLGS